MLGARPISDDGPPEPLTGPILKRLRIIALLPFFALLGGCNLVVLDPSGDIAARQSDLLIESTGLMLLIIVPVIALTLLFAWRYRESNKAATYAPDWDPDGKYRIKIITLLPDWIIEAEFNNLEMPVRLVRIIEDRLRPPPPPDPNSFDCGGAMVTPGPDC